MPQKKKVAPGWKKRPCIVEQEVSETETDTMVNKSLTEEMVTDSMYLLIVTRKAVI